MTADEARERVGEIRAGADRIMRALSIPGPDWKAAADAASDCVRMSGELRVRCGDHGFEGTVEEIERAVALVGRLRRLGVEVGHTEIRVPIAEEGDEDGA